MVKSDVGPRLLQSINEWPRGWAYEDRDVRLGQDLVALVLPFLEGLVQRGLSETSLRRHFRHVAILGSEIIRRVQTFEKDRRRSPRELLLDEIGEDGGPLSSDNDSEELQRSFDGTCRRLYRFITQNAQ